MIFRLLENLFALIKRNIQVQPVVVDSLKLALCDLDLLKKLMEEVILVLKLVFNYWILNVLDDGINVDKPRSSIVFYFENSIF